MALASVAGLGPPLTTRRVLAVNLVTDILPAVAVVVQEPEQRDLASLAREGTAALGTTLRRDVRRRGVATALPSFAAYVLAGRAGGGNPRRQRAVAFTTIVSGQLAQALELGAAEGGRSRVVAAAVAGRPRSSPLRWPWRPSRVSSGCGRTDAVWARAVRGGDARVGGAQPGPG